MTYLWQKPEWPYFSWSSSELLDPLVKARFEQGRLLSLPSGFVHSFEVSEIKKHIYADLISNFAPPAPPLSLERLHGWQASLYPTGYSGVKKIAVAEIRKRDLFNWAPPAREIDNQLDQFLRWWREPPVGLDSVLRSAMAFFWFYTLSPYEDGNFDLACALSELALQQDEKTPIRNYDLSLQFEDNKSDSIEKITKALSGSGDITSWILFYLEQYQAAVSSAYAIADKNQTINLFWKTWSNFDLNQRQRRVLNKMLEENPEITNREYVEICKTSRESAKRDLAELVKMGILRLGSEKGRSVRYSL